MVDLFSKPATQGELLFVAATTALTFLLFSCWRSEARPRLFSILGFWHPRIRPNPLKNTAHPSHSRLRAPPGRLSRRRRNESNVAISLFESVHDQGPAKTQNRSKPIIYVPHTHTTWRAKCSYMSLCARIAPVSWPRSVSCNRAARGRTPAARATFLTSKRTGELIQLPSHLLGFLRLHSC